MEVVPLSVGVASRAWDEQHVDLAAAAEQVAGAGSSGFTAAVSGTASRFLTQWQRHTSGLGDAAEAQADGLRACVRDYVTSDEAVGHDLMLLLGFVAEQR